GDQVCQLHLRALDRGVRPTSQPRRGVPGVVDDRRQGVRHRLAEHCRAATRVGGVLTQHSGTPLAQACWMFSRCSAYVSANADSPPSVSATKKYHPPSAGSIAASIAALPGLLIGPGGRPGWVRVLYVLSGCVMSASLICPEWIGSSPIVSSQ